MRGKIRRDTAAKALLDHMVGVDKTHAPKLGQLPANGGFSAAWKAYQCIHGDGKNPPEGGFVS
ncbi:hypothetical protein D3C86_2266720 [compost metagenome]